MSYVALAEVALAISDLKAVKAVTDAINAGVPGFRGPLGNINTPLKAPLPQPRADIGPGGLGGLRDVYEPEPRFEPRHVYTPEPRFEPRARIELPPEVAPGDKPADLKAPFGPVWQDPPAEATLPAQSPTIRHPLKAYDRMADTTIKGSILDRVI